MQFLPINDLVASVGDAKMFSNERQFAAWLGLVTKQYSNGGKTRLGRMRKHGDVYLRTLLIHGSRLTNWGVHIAPVRPGGEQRHEVTLLASPVRHSVRRLIALRNLK